MERKLANLFDRQRFQQNTRLAAIIGNVESRYAGALDDEDLELVSAAGDSSSVQKVEPASIVAPDRFGEDQPVDIIFCPPLMEQEGRWE